MFVVLNNNSFMQMIVTKVFEAKNTHCGTMAKFQYFKTNHVLMKVIVVDIYIQYGLKCQIIYLSINQSIHLPLMLETLTVSYHQRFRYQFIYL